MRVEIFKDGSIQGWFINTVWTLVTLTMLCIGFFVTRVKEGWVAYGNVYAMIYLGGMTAWFAYKVANKKVEGSAGIPQETVADALKKVTEAMASFQKK